MKKILKIGDETPVIYESDIWGREVNVPANGSWIYLSFHRFAACPFCNLRTNELIQNYDLFQNHNIEIISVWPSPKESLLRYAGSEKTPFPMLSGNNKSIYRAYGVTESSFIGAVRLLLHPQLITDTIKTKPKGIAIDSDPKLMPASFLIEPDGFIRMAYYGKHYGDHPKIKSVIQSIKL